MLILATLQDQERSRLACAWSLADSRSPSGRQSLPDSTRQILYDFSLHLPALRVRLLSIRRVRFPPCRLSFACLPSSFPSPCFPLPFSFLSLAKPCRRCPAAQCCLCLDHLIFERPIPAVRPRRPREARCVLTLPRHAPRSLVLSFDYRTWCFALSPCCSDEANATRCPPPTPPPSTNAACRSGTGRAAPPRRPWRRRDGAP